MAVKVLAIHALDELRDALTRFGGQAAQTLQATAREVQQTLGWLAERARAALERCRSSAAYDRDGRRVGLDCGDLERALAEARARLRRRRPSG